MTTATTKTPRPRRMARALDVTAQPQAKPTSKLDQLEALLLAEPGASLAEMMAATGWQPHSVRGAMAGLKRDFPDGLDYRIAYDPTVFVRASLEAVRELPAHATAGQPVTYHVSLRNLSGRPLKRFQLQETPPDPRPDEATFRLSEEPGEKLRNVFDRTFVYYRWNWLCEKRLLFDGGSSSFVEARADKKAARVDGDLSATFHALVMLFHRLKELPALVTLDELTVRQELSEKGTIAASFRLRIPLRAPE